MHAHYQSAAHEAQEELQAEWEKELAEKTPRCYFPEEMQIDRNDPLAVQDETPQHVIDAMADKMVDDQLRDREAQSADEEDDEEFGEPDVPKEERIEIVVFHPGQFPRVVTIENNLNEMQKLVGGLIEVFSIGIAGVVGVCNEEFLDLGLPPNRRIRAIGTVICGTFFIVGDGANMRSLTASQIVQVLINI